MKCPYQEDKLKNLKLKKCTYTVVNFYSPGSGFLKKLALLKQNVCFIKPQRHPVYKCTESR